MSRGRRLGFLGLAGSVTAGLAALSFAAASSLTTGEASPSVDAPPVMLIASAAAPVGVVPDQVWLADTSSRTGVDPVALRAYASATLRLAEESPDCHLGWNTLGAIGAVESAHGTHGGGELLADGRSTVPIIGPALDGRDTLARIPASPGYSAWHGDSVWDHAVGPFQFIGSTWATWQADGDGDGVADPTDIDDAALAAGRYLCAAGGDLTTGVGWSRAVFAYNHSEQYVRTVLDVARALR